MRLTPLFALIPACLLAASAAACSGGGDKAPTPPGGFSGGGSDVTVTVAGESWEYKDGICTTGDGDSYFSLNAGNTATGEYFGLVAGLYPGAPEGIGTPRAATGGGDFTGRPQTVVTFKHKNRSYLLSFDATKVTLAADLKAGSFTAMLTSAAGGSRNVSGTFTCGG